MTVSSEACTGSCSGKCHGSGRMWVIAACGGYMALYEKWHRASTELIPIGKEIPPDSPEGLVALVAHHYAAKKFEQLLLVGSQNDLRWVQLLLPPEIANCVVAEIRYPLQSSWFTEMPQTQSLHNTMQSILQG